MTVPIVTISTVAQPVGNAIAIDANFVELLRNSIRECGKNLETTSGLAGSMRDATESDHTAVLHVKRVRGLTRAVTVGGYSDDTAKKLAQNEAGRSDGVVHQVAAERTSVVRGLGDVVSSHGMQSVLAIPLLEAANSSLFGVVVHWSPRHDGFDCETVHRATVTADLLATVLGAAAAKTQFEAALESRDAIGQAKGMIMERYEIGAEQAFALLARLSQDTNTPLAAVASKLTTQATTSET